MDYGHRTYCWLQHMHENISFQEGLVGTSSMSVYAQAAYFYDPFQ